MSSRLLIALLTSLVCGQNVALPQKNVTAILPNGRQIRPAGNWIPLAPYPFSIALKLDGSEAAIPSIGFPFALNVVSHPESAAASVRRMPGFDATDNDPNIEVHAGVAYSPDGQTLYVATGNSGKVDLYATADWHKIATIPLDAKLGETEYAGSFAATLVLSPDGRTLYVLDQGNFRVALIETASRTIVANLPTGNYPYGLALSPDGQRLYVTNIGLFTYSAIPGASAKDPIGTGLKFPPFGYPSRAAREGATVEGRQIPGLGDENSTRGSSLWTYDVHDSAHPAKSAELRLGERITQATNGTVGSAAPTGVVASSDAVYVSLSHQDAVVKITPDGTHQLAEAALTPFSGPKFQDAQGRPLRGVMPSGLALGTGPSQGKLFVAESGIDAVAVLDAEKLAVLEHIPAGWNPSAVAVSPEGKTLYIINSKGKGAGPNGGSSHDPKTPTYVGALDFGSLSVVELAGLTDATTLTGAVIAANTYAIVNRPAMPRLKHTFLVVRENRTFDEVLGDIPGVNGDPTLTRYGIDGWAEERHTTTREAEHLKVTPNLHAIAARFAISDNFYVDSDVSADGHRWVMGINPTPFFNTAWSSGYGGRRSDYPGAAQPGRRALFGGADAPMPEDEPQFGSQWEHLANSGLGILNYGEGLEIEGNAEIHGTAPEGQRLFLNSPVPEPVFEHTDRAFPTFNLGIPDQVRFEEFKRDFSRRIANRSVPALIVIRLCNDHTADPRPADGYPYRASYVADNDLALGKIVEYLSKTPLWQDSALFVTEDDAQDGIDHVDAHRSILAIASPWVIPGSVSHQHSSMGSITRTINELLGLSPLNLEDALAGDLTGIFQTKANRTPFASLASDVRVFDPARAKIAKPKTAKQAAALRDMDDAVEIQKHLDATRSDLKRPAKDTQ